MKTTRTLSFIASFVLFVGTVMLTAPSMSAESTSVEDTLQAQSAAQASLVPPRRLVMFNHRLQVGEETPRFPVPSGRILVITDIVVQNRSPGDEPVDPSAFSRLFLGPFLVNAQPAVESDIAFTVVGNNTLNLHYTTGMRVPISFRVSNVVNSTASFIEVNVTGYLVAQ